MSAKNVKWEKIIDVCNVDFGTRVVRKKDGGSIYPVYGGGGETFKMDIFNRENCLVVSRFAMSPQCTRFVKGKFFLNDSGLSLSSKDFHILSEEFLNTIILGLNDEIYALGRGAAQKNLNVEAFKELRIPVPPLDEQKRIVNVLDETFEKIEKIKANAQANLQNAKDLFQTTLANELSITDEKIKQGWEEKNIGDVLETSSGGTPLKSHKDYYENGTIPWLRSGEVCQKEINETEMFITEKGLANSSAKLFPKNTVAVAMYGATAGQVGILRFKTTTNQAVCGILPRQEFLPEFIYYVLLNKKEELVAQAVGGAQPNISQIKIRCTSIPILTIDDQKQIVAKLDSLSEKVKQLESNYKQILADCDELKKSILKKAFNGEL